MDYEFQYYKVIANLLRNILKIEKMFTVSWALIQRDLLGDSVPNDELELVWELS